MSQSDPSEIAGPRILFLSPAAGLGGAERCLIDFVWACRRWERKAQIRVLSLAQGPLVQALEKEGADVSVLELPPELAELGEHAGARRITFAHLARGVGATASFLKRLMQTTHGFAPDIVHTNGMKAHLLGTVVAPLRARLVVHLHDFVSTRKMTRFVLPKIAARKARFIANSHAVADDFRTLAPRARLSVVYNAIDTDYFRPGALDPDWLADAAGLPRAAPDSISFGLIATYAPWKGHLLYLEAARRFFAARPDSSARFYIVGGPIYSTPGSQLSRQEIELRIVELGLVGRVGLIPFQADIAKVFQALNVLVHASTKPEPFGRTVVEAMSAERPVLVSNQGGVTELFQDGVTALGFESGSPGELCRQMQRLESSPSLRASLGFAGRRSAVARFSRDRLSGELAHGFGLD